MTENFDALFEEINASLGVHARRTKRREAAYGKPDIAMDVADVPVYPDGLRIHGGDFCRGETCCFHNPSPHHMREWPINVRLDRFAMPMTP